MWWWMSSSSINKSLIYLIIINSPPRLLKNHDFTYSPILLPSNKKPIHPTWLSQNPTKINSFCNQTFHTSFCIHLWHFSTKIAQKPWLHLFTNLSTKAQNPIHPTWPSQNRIKIYSFCNQTFHTSFWMHLWQFPTKIAQKPWLHFFTNFASTTQKLGQATKLG